MAENLLSSISATSADFVFSLSPAAWCQTFFALASSAVLAVAVTPPSARRYLLDYGARASRNGDGGGRGEMEKEAQEAGSLVRFAAALTSWSQVPHAWFMAFYAASIACSIFWAIQYLAGGVVFRLVASKQAQASPPSMTVTQVIIVWALMLLQATRRLYEHLSFVKSSNSKMWIVHWLLGISFYVSLSLSIWVEGSESLLANPFQDIDTPKSPPRTMAAAAVFILAGVAQSRCHRYLAGLKKYSLPQNGMFRFLVCPHYSCECLIYAALMVAAAPEGYWYNRTLSCALLFVLINLGVTASGTRRWYIGKFGSESVASRWVMIPFVF